jgi:DNA ligase-1
MNASIDRLQELYNLREKLQSTSGALKKQAILSKTNGEYNGLFNLIYNTDIPFHVTSAHVKKYSPNRILGNNPMSITELLHMLHTRSVTGNAALETVHRFFVGLPEHLRELTLDIIDKDLKIGMNIKTINKALPGCIQDVFPGVALGTNYDSKYITNPDDWYISRKLDGIRCIAIVKSPDDIRFYSRTGKEFHTLDELKTKLSSSFTEPVVYDGEITSTLGSDNFKQIVSDIRKKNFCIASPCYQIFDCLTLSEFYSEWSSRNLLERLKKVPELLTPVTQYPFSQFDKLQHDVQENQWEGLIIRKNSEYLGKRSNELLKFKEFHTEEYTVLDVTTGDMRWHNGENYQDITTLSGVTIQHKGTTVTVGSGFSMEERHHYYKNPQEIIGKVISVQFFEETETGDGVWSLRFPTFKGLYSNGRDM